MRKGKEVIQTLNPEASRARLFKPRETRKAIASPLIFFETFERRTARVEFIGILIVLLDIVISLLAGRFALLNVLSILLRENV